MIDSFTDAVKFLERYIPLPSKIHPGSLGLERMKYLVGLLGNPQNDYKTVHVGGTSGKGSTSTIIAAILGTKYKTGLHTSPHLIKITERINIGGKDITEEEFVQLVKEIEPAVKEMETGRLGPPSYFEIVTAMAFLFFKKEKVEIAVIEVGMGGMFDATNVIIPEVAVLTSVGLDHTEILGDTVEKIASDKVGIIKHGIKVVSGVKQKPVIEIVEKACKKQEAKLSLLNRDFKYEIRESGEKGCIFDYLGDKTYKNLKLNIIGEFQAENAALAIRTAELLGGFEETSIREALSKVFVAGRMEIIGRKPTVILDGAHNPDKIRALTESLKLIFKERKITAVVAIKYDKNASEMLSILLPLCRRVIFTSYSLVTDLGNINSHPPGALVDLAGSISRDIPAEAVEGALKALEQAGKISEDDGIILVTGSLYLVGEVRKLLIGKRINYSKE